MCYQAFSCSTQIGMKILKIAIKGTKASGIVLFKWSTWSKSVLFSVHKYENVNVIPTSACYPALGITSLPPLTCGEDGNFGYCLLMTILTIISSIHFIFYSVQLSKQIVKLVTGLFRILNSDWLQIGFSHVEDHFMICIPCVKRW